MVRVIYQSLAMVRVLVADCAIQFAGATTDEARAISYLNAFRESQMVAELIKWVYSQAGTVSQNARTEIITPRALMSWILVLENQDIQVFDDGMLTLCAKALACTQSVEIKSPQHKLHKVDVDEDQEMGDQSNNGFPGDLCTMSSGKKLKEAVSGVEELRVKQVKA